MISKNTAEDLLDEIYNDKKHGEHSQNPHCDIGETSISYYNQEKPQWEIENTVIRICGVDESNSLANIQQQSSNPQKLDPSSAYKTSKVRRTEYSMRSVLGQCSNPSASQDSAFGSMTDGEISRASSFKLSSFQSISSPIDEGVEDSTESRFLRSNDAHNYNMKSSCSTYSKLKTSSIQSLNNLDVNAQSTLPVSTVGALNYSDLPKLMVNDDNYVFTSSPKQKCGLNDYFSHKNRVSSFEDLSLNSGFLREACKKQSRSLEQEERRIETAFTPIILSNVCTKNEYENYQNTGVSDLFETTSTEKRSTIWKNSITKKPDDKASEKSNDKPKVINERDSDHQDIKINVSDDEIDEIVSMRASGDETARNLIQQRLRISFNLSKFKQNAIAESVNIDTSSESSAHERVKHSNSSNENDDSNVLNSTNTSTSNDGCYSDEETSSSLTESLLETPSIEDVRKFVKSFDSEDKSNGSIVSGELAPLLGIEMQSMSSSTDPE